MSIAIMMQVWNITLPDSQKIVLLALADNANDEGLCWPSIATISKKCSKSERTIQGVIKDLVEKGHMSREEVPGKGCRYIIHPRTDCTPAEPAPPQGTTHTPAAAAPKPSRTINAKNTESRPRKIEDCWKPQDFSPDSKSGAIVAGWSKDERDTTIEHFIAHHQAKETKAVDWQPWWKTWVLNSKKFGGQRNGQQRSQDLFSSRDNRSTLTRTIDDALERFE